MAIPIVDYRGLAADRTRLLSDVRHALANVGFMVLANAPGLDAGFQQRVICEVRRFFDAPPEVKATASIAKTPYYRGHSPPVQTASQLVETFQYGERASCVTRRRGCAAVEADFYGPNTWPDEGLLPGFRPAVEALREAYVELHHELGHLICESLGVDPRSYDELFDPDDLRLAAFLSHGFSLSHIEQGGIAMNRHVVSGREGREGVARELQKKMSHGAHVDITPFMTLLTMDKPGLQVLSGSDEWLDMPILPGAVCVNVGSTLQHLSGGKMVATVHRVNTSLIPDGETRISLPFFLLPKFEGALVPFSADDSGIHTTGGGTNYGSEDRGMMAAYNRMSLFPLCTKRWWTAEYQRIMDRVRRAEAVENSVARAKVLTRRQTQTAAL